MRLAMLIEREAGFSGSWMLTTIILNGMKKRMDLPSRDVPAEVIDHECNES
jgi:hypothetical protein